MPRSPENEALLNERIDELQQIVEILKEIRDNPNIGEKKTCDKYGIDFHRFRRYVYDSEWAMKSSGSTQIPGGSRTTASACSCLRAQRRRCSLIPS